MQVTASLGSGKAIWFRFLAPACYTYGRLAGPAASTLKMSDLPDASRCGLPACGGRARFPPAAGSREGRVALPRTVA